MNCTNVTLEGFSSDTLTPPFSQGVLVGVDLAAATLDLEIEAGFPLPTATESPLFNQTCADGNPGFCGEIKVIFWDNATRLMYQGQQMQVSENRALRPDPILGVSCHPFRPSAVILGDCELGLASCMGSGGWLAGATRGLVSTDGLCPTPQNPLGNVECTGSRCTAQVRVALNWVPPVGALVTLSPRAFASRYPIPTFCESGYLSFEFCIHVDRSKQGTPS